MLPKAAEIVRLDLMCVIKIMSGSVRRDGVAGTSMLSKRHLLDNMMKDKQTKEQYLENLAAPLDVTQGCRIPDMCAYPSSVFTDIVETTVTIDADAGGAYRGGFFVAITPGGIAVYREAAASTSAVIVFDAAALTLASGAASVKAGYKSSRVVGAGMLIEFIGSDSNNQGMIQGTYLTSQDLYASLGGFTSVTALVNSRMSFSSAFKNGMQGHYVPLDPNDLLYRPVYNPTGDAFTDANAAGYRPSCGFQVHVNSNAGVNVRLTVVGHYEGLPLTDSLVVGQLGDAPNDVMALQWAVNHARVIPLLQSGPVITPGRDTTTNAPGDAGDYVYRTPQRQSRKRNMMRVPVGPRKRPNVRSISGFNRRK